MTTNSDNLAMIQAEALAILEERNRPIGHGCSITMVITQAGRIINPTELGEEFERQCRTKCQNFALAMRLVERIAKL